MTGLDGGDRTSTGQPADEHEAVIVLVEDEAPNRALARAVLARADHAAVRSARLVEATTLAEARAALAHEPVDVVVLDVRLPDGTGLDLAREIRSRAGAGRPRVLILSASVLPTERAAALEAGADDFLPKPYRAGDLVARLADLLAGRAAG